MFAGIKNIQKYFIESLCLLLSRSVANYVSMVQKILFVCFASQREDSASADETEKEKHESGKTFINILITLVNNYALVSGRVHSAMVSKLNPAQRSVTVEWYERGETKGKEVELDMLLALNPELMPNKQSFVAPPTTATAPVNLQRVSKPRRSSLRVLGSQIEAWK